MKTLALFVFVLVFFGAQIAESKVYKNVKVGQYEFFLDLNEYTGQPFFQTMKDEIYPLINAAAEAQRRGSHLQGIKDGEGVEVYLTQDVTTYHVKYKADHEDKVERSGRSFGVVGADEVRDYVADASYLHYLRTLGRLLEGDDFEVEAFFRAIALFMTNSDTTGFDGLSFEAKKVAADFVAIYIAEQYRRLTATKGRYLGKRHRWDDALVQVTLLSAFHSGQDQFAMFYEGELTSEVFHQSACLYKAKGQEEKRARTEKRRAKLSDYWQFTVRSKCPGRSGVNLTRRDFEKMGRAVTKNLKQNFPTQSLRSLGGRSSNVFKRITEKLLKGDLAHDGEIVAQQLVEVLMLSRSKAILITSSLE